MAGRKSDFTLTRLDDLFTTQAQREEERLSKIRDIPLELIDDFPDHPFKVRDDEDMQQLVESIKERGVITPATVRQKEDGRYELVSGHRRKRASELAGFETLRCEVVDLNRDEATILMVESNFQRSQILPSEKAFAYKMRLEAMKHQGKRIEEIPDDELGIEYKTTSGQVGPKSDEENRSDYALAEQVGISRKQIQRFIRLTYLIEPLQEMVDGRHENEIKIAFNPAVELSYLTESEQYDLANAIVENQRTPSLAQCQEFKRLSHDGELTTEFIEDTLSEEKPNQREKLSFQMKEIDKYFPKDFTPGKKKDLMIHLLENWAKKRSREQER